MKALERFVDASANEVKQHPRLAALVGFAELLAAMLIGAGVTHLVHHG